MCLGIVPQEVSPASTGSWGRTLEQITDEHNQPGDEHEPPTGALIAILLYLLLVVALWTNSYLRLWVRG